LQIKGCKNGETNGGHYNGPPAKVETFFPPRRTCASRLVTLVRLLAALFEDRIDYRMNTATTPIARPRPSIERENLPIASPPRRFLGLRALLARPAKKEANHHAATFFRIEYRQASPVSRYTTARDAQLCAECLGPPPLGL
jgi:hypothetical protein